jgi:hypothetical protein
MGVNMGIFKTIVTEISHQLKAAYTIMLKSMPNIIVALGIIIIGYFIALLLGFVTTRILYKFNLDKRIRRDDLKDSLGTVSFARFSGKVVKWVVFILFLTQGIAYLPFGIFSDMFKKIVYWLPNLVFGILIIVFGWIFIDFITYKILELQWKYTRPMIQAIKALLVFVIVITAVDQLGVNISFLKNVFLIVFAAVALATALVVGISMGLGMKGEAKNWFKKYRKK